MPIAQLPVFVYGTLRPGQINYLRLLAGKTVREVPATCQERLHYDADGDYPYLAPGEGAVAGDLLTLSAAHYENGSIYLRRKTRVTLAKGEQTEARVYFWNCPGIRETWIDSGDFLNRGK